MAKVEEKTLLYRKVLQICTDFPPNEKSHYELFKKEARLLAMQLTDVQKEIKALQYEKAHLVNNELPTFKSEVS
jgi:hypothetical protein